MDVLLQRQHIGKKTMGLTLTGLVVLDATHHHGRTLLPGSPLQFGLRIPVHGMYTVIQIEVMVLLQQGSGVDNAQKLLPTLGVNPEINAKQFGRNYLAACFLKRFANGCLFRRFTVFDVPARLSDYHDAGGGFLDDQETAFGLNESGYCQISR